MLAFLVLLVMMFFYGIVPTANVVWLPVFLLLALVTSLRAGLWLSTMNVPVSGRALRGAVFGATLALRHAVALPEQHVRAVAYALLCRQSHGRCGRRVPLGVARGWGAARAWCVVVRHAQRGALLVSNVLFRRMEKTFADVV
ncbi:MAG: hypothetical protein R2854_16435 [Caldilineaceae bacterium]